MADQLYPGDVVRLETTFTAGDPPVPADPGTVTVTVRAPDGSTSTPTVSNMGTGEYRADVTATLAGMWVYRWTGAGAVVGVDEGTFTVLASLLTATRPGMGSLIAEVREITGAGTADVTDGAIERLLDESRHEYRRVASQPVARLVAGTVQYLEHVIGGPLEQGTAFVVTDTTGGTVGTAAYTVDYRAGVLTFATSRQEAVYIDARRYDRYAASAGVLEEWAASLAVSSYGLTQDGQRLDRQHRMESMRSLAATLRRKSGAKVTRMHRADG